MKLRRRKASYISSENGACGLDRSSQVPVSQVLLAVFSGRFKIRLLAHTNQHVSLVGSRFSRGQDCCSHCSRQQWLHWYNLILERFPAGQTFALQLLDGTTVNVLGEIQFGNLSWAGPLFEVRGNDITFNGNNQRWDGGGPFYWDGQGTNTGKQKPHPMMEILISGTLNDVYVVNSPAHAFAISNPGPITISGVTVDDSQGNYPNSLSGKSAAAHNTDGFDVSGSNIIIQKSTVINQDDCLAINSGTNITFADNYCQSGHGISIGSISSNTVVSDVEISGNHVVSSAYSFRIKTDATATNSAVKRVTYNANSAANCTSYGVLITQSYPSNMGTPGNGVTISDIKFAPGTTSLTANSGAYMVAVNCGSGTCTGDWDWSGLTASGGKTGTILNNDVITGFNQY